jgi:formylglycine-generating enzyme required for sulfatase activity
VTKIIISYRRSDSDVFAGRLRDRIAGNFGEESVFIDVDSIPFGKDFRVHIQEAMAKADAILVVVGPRWLGGGKGGHSRIKDDTDPVRIEVETALSKGIPTIPILVGQTNMPKPEQLPESLRSFAFINAAPVDTGRDFHRDLSRVIATINTILERPTDADNEREEAEKQRGEEPRLRNEAEVKRRAEEEALPRLQPVEPRPTGRQSILTPVILSLIGVAITGAIILSAFVFTPLTPISPPKPVAQPVPVLPKPPAVTPSPVPFAPTPGANSVLSLETEQALKPKATFKECGNCPEMIVVPAGSFTMGAPANEPGRGADEGPQHAVTFARQFAVGKFALTFDEWEACVADGGCNGHNPSDQGWGRGRRPVINLSWDDTKAYVAWLSKKTGKTYRLLSEAEREYVTRAGTTTPFWWGNSISTTQANYDGSHTYGNGLKGEFRGRTVPVDMFEPNRWGLYQVHGNVWDWTEDCYHPSYQGAPADGSAWTSSDCSHHVVRGGSWHAYPGELRSASRNNGIFPTNGPDVLGFRVARTLLAP